MLEPRRHEDLALEALRVHHAGEGGGERLDGDPALEQRLHRQEDDAHATAPELALDHDARAERRLEARAQLVVLRSAGVGAVRRVGHEIGSEVLEK
jgi:hypothetical protein